LFFIFNINIVFYTFTFSKLAKRSNDPILHHYSVLYPAGTINSMANFCIFVMNIGFDSTIFIINK